MSGNLRAACVGIVAGTAGGLFGVGGGIVIVPALVFWFDFEQHRAHATSVAAIAAIAGGALIPFAVEGAVDWAAAAALLVGSGLGAFLGARVMGRIPAVWLARGFSVVLVAAAVRMLAA